MTLASIFKSVGVAHALAGQSDGTSTAGGALALALPLEAAAAGASTAVGDLTAPRAFAGTSAGTSTATGSLGVSPFYARVTSARRPDTTTSARRRAGP